MLRLSASDLGALYTPLRLRQMSAERSLRDQTPKEEKYNDRLMRFTEPGSVPISTTWIPSMTLSASRPEGHSFLLQQSDENSGLVRSVLLQLPAYFCKQTQGIQTEFPVFYCTQLKLFSSLTTLKHCDILMVVLRNHYRREIRNGW